MEAADFFETVVLVWKTTQDHMPEDRDLNIYGNEYFISPSILCILFILEPYFLSFSHVHVAGLCYIILHINSGACIGTALLKNKCAYV
jgi:hypothetical protein